MTPKELRKKLGGAIHKAYHRPHATLNDVADAALAVVRDAMREPDAGDAEGMP